MPSAKPPQGARPWAGRWRVQLTAAVLARYGTVCHLCRGEGATTADHLTPRSRGGSDGLDNLRPAHHGCNSRRGDTPLPVWFAANPVPHRPTLPPSRPW